MKSALALFTILLSLSVSAEITPNLNFEGTYKIKRPVYAFGYNSKKDCKADGGVYTDGACVFKDGGATVEIKKNAAGNFDLSVSSVGTNFHLCNYEGEATALNAVQLTSNDFNAEYPGECELTVAFTSQKTLSIITNNKCSDFCGANMSLDESDYKRVK